MATLVLISDARIRNVDGPLTFVLGRDGVRNFLQTLSSYDDKYRELRFDQRADQPYGEHGHGFDADGQPLPVLALEFKCPDDMEMSWLSCPVRPPLSFRTCRRTWTRYNFQTIESNTHV